MTVDRRLPVIVGAGQVVRRGTTAVGADEPAQMIAEGLRLAAGDAGPGARLLESAGAVYVTDVLSWRYSDPAGAVGERVGAPVTAARMRVATGGDGPQRAMAHACDAIQQGELDVALLGGGEAMHTRALARRESVWLPWEKQADVAPTGVLGDDRPGSHDVELAHGLALPVQVYPLLEVAFRAASGAAPPEHRRDTAELWAAFSAVAAENPSAWSASALTAGEIATPGPANRMVSSPYTKLLCANLQVDQAAALIVCSVEAARRLAVPEDRWVFVHAAATAHDRWWISERDRFDRSPAIAACGSALRATTGRAAADHDLVDLYSCFPSAVRIAAAELGLPLDASDPPTVTGGLTFAGGPGNAYAFHSIARTVELLRERDRGATALVTALGWYVTKHALAVYGTDPPASGSFRWDRCDGAAQAAPARPFVSEGAGPATVEAATVAFDREGAPTSAIASCLLPDGTRAWARTTDADDVGRLVGDAEEVAGLHAELDGSGRLRLADDARRI